MKPLIFVCGDDDGRLYQLTPASEEAGDWNYDVEILYESVVPGIVHSVLNWLDFVDLNGDGQEEMMVSLYHERKAIIYEWSDGVHSNDTAIA